MLSDYAVISLLLNITIAAINDIKPTDAKTLTCRIGKEFVEANLTGS